MPLCQPSVVASSSKHQWVIIKQDSHLSLQECKIVGKSWWSSGEVTWAYRVVLTATDTQLAYASDITQIVTDWEFVQKLVSEVPLLDPEASPAANAEMIARVFQRRWDAKQPQQQQPPQQPQPPQQQQQPSPSQERDNISIEVTNCSSSSSGGGGGSGEQQQQKPSSEKRSSGSRIFFRTPIGTPTSIKRLMLGAEATPFPGIPLHREGQPAPVTPRRSSEIAPSSAEHQPADSNDARPNAAVDSGAAAAQMVRERELQGKLERSLDAVEKAVTAPAGLQQDQHYRIYADCIHGLLHELRAVKNGAGATTAVAGTAPLEASSSSTSTAELLCLLSRASLDAARVLVASQKQQLDHQQQQQQHKEGSSQETDAVVTTAEAVAPSSSAPSSTTEAASGDEDLHKAKEGQGDDAEPGGGDTEKAMPPVSATGVESNSSDTHLSSSAGSVGERETSPKGGDTSVDAVKRLQRCLELFAAASKSLNSMAEHNGSVTTD